ncbi:MAG TPA: GNAT family N-acetyltransferase [Pyrinomonadaceae bacterium]|nr:GNAT family N-acetyltransferase [Pyrinomonadaceae bacterium]
MSDETDYEIRPADASDETFLWEMLYQSIYVEAGKEPYPREVLQRPEVAKYVRGWGRAGDLGFIAVDSKTGQPIGAAWCRLLKGEEKGFAYVDDLTPELGIALLPEYRGRGIGTALLERLLQEAKSLYPAISLSVAPHNPAMRLYRRFGFETFEIRKAHPVMKRELNG